MKSAIVFSFIFNALALALIAAEPTPSPASSAPPAPSACNAPEFHQFDFWLGSWIVRTPDGKRTTGTSQITRASSDCAILEQWKSAKGLSGTSINFYDTATQHWHQVWVGGDGTILKLEGELKNGAMILEGEQDDPRQATLIKNRITWTPLPEGKVKQEWATSADGKVWQTSFVGIYSRE